MRHGHHILRQTIFKVQFGDTVVAYNPHRQRVKTEGARFGADIAVVSLNHPDFSGAESVAYGEKKPFAVTGPGEYEINGVSVRGFQTQSQYAKESKLNTVYLVELEGIKLCFLGQLHTAELSEKTREALDGIDILFVPVGGNETLSPLKRTNSRQRWNRTLSFRWIMTTKRSKF